MIDAMERDNKLCIFANEKFSMTFIVQKHGADGCQTNKVRSINNRVFQLTDLFTD